MSQLEALGFEVAFDPAGTLGVGVALEVCRLAADAGLDLPLQVMAFLEEEGCCSAAGSWPGG